MKLKINLSLFHTMPGRSSVIKHDRSVKQEELSIVELAAKVASTGDAPVSSSSGPCFSSDQQSYGFWGSRLSRWLVESASQLDGKGRGTYPIPFFRAPPSGIWLT